MTEESITNSDDTVAEEQDYDPGRAMFRDGAPSIGIGSTDVLRASLLPMDDPEQETEEPNNQFHITTIPGPQPPESPVALLGDLAITSGGWFVGVTVVMTLHFRNADEAPNPDDTEALNSFGEVIGPWASNVLYDVAAMKARQLTSSSSTCEVEVPLATLRPHITRISKRSQDDD